TVGRRWLTVVTIAAAAGFVVKLAMGSSFPIPSGWVASAKTYGFLGSSPVTAAWRTCTKPWLNKVTCVAGFPPGGDSLSWVDCAAAPLGCRLSRPSPLGTAAGTYATP